LNKEDFAGLQHSIKESLNFEQSLHLLRRKSEALCKLYKKTETYGELIQWLQQVSTATGQTSSPEAEIKSKVIAMYMFELLAEYHLPQELIVQNSTEFMTLFNSSI
jgi:hypothetical protein